MGLIPSVIPGLTRNPVFFWIPAFAGMTPFGAINVAVQNRTFLRRKFLNSMLPALCDLLMEEERHGRI